MSDALRLYYLNQMGITPWICKSNTPSHLISSAVLICSAGPLLDARLKKILDHIIFFLSSSREEVTHLVLDGHNQALMVQSDYILFLGCEKNNLMTTKPDACILETASLDYWMQHPLAKKQLFMELTSLKHKLS